MTYTFSLALNPLRTFRITKKRLSLIFQAFNDFFEDDRVFQWKKWSIKVAHFSGETKAYCTIKAYSN